MYETTLYPMEGTAVGSLYPRNFDPSSSMNFTLLSNVLILLFRSSKDIGANDPGSGSNEISRFVPSVVGRYLIIMTGIVSMLWAAGVVSIVFIVPYSGGLVTVITVMLIVP